MHCVFQSRYARLHIRLWCPTLKKHLDQPLRDEPDEERNSISGHSSRPSRKGRRLDPVRYFVRDARLRFKLATADGPVLPVPSCKCCTSFDNQSDSRHYRIHRKGVGFIPLSTSRPAGLFKRAGFRNPFVFCLIDFNTFADHV